MSLQNATAADYSRRSRWLACAIGLLMTGAFGVAHLSPLPAWQVLFDNVQWTVADVGAALLAWQGCRQHDTEQPARRWFAWGLSSYAFGQLVWNLQVFSGWNPFPAPADVFYAACGPCMAFGFWASLRARVPASRLRSLRLDAVILITQTLVLVLVLYLAHLPEVTWLQLLQLAIYPVVMFGSAVVGLVMAMALGLRAHWRWQALLLGMIATGAVWMRWNTLALHGAPPNGSWLNYAFSVAALVNGIGAACWRPGAAAHSETREHYAGFFILLPLLMVLAAGCTVLLVWDNVDLPRAVRVAAMCGAALVIVLSAVRQGFWLAESERLRSIEYRVVENERQYRELAQRHELAAGAAHIGIWDLQLPGRKVYWDQRMFALFGVTTPAAQTEWQVWEQCTHPDDRQAVHAAFVTATATHAELRVEYRVITPEGQLRHLEAHGVIQYDPSGRPVRVTGVSWDVTDRVVSRRALAESEAELSAIFENSVIGIVLVDQQRNILRSNRAARDLLGYSVEQVRTLHAEDVIHPDELELSRRMFAALLQGERQAYELEKRYRRSDGQYLWVRVAVYPVVRDRDRQFAVLIEDISQRKQMEAALLEVQRDELRLRAEFSRHLLNAQEQERQRIASELHDGLAQNLSVIKNRAQLAIEQAAEGALAAQLQGILRVTTDAIAEVRGLAHNLRPLHIEQLGLTAALTQLLEQFAQASRLQVESRLEAIDEVFAPHQVTHIYRLLQEALNNIDKHARARHVRVRIERDLHVVRIEVSDDGVGFDPEQALHAGGLGLNSMTERAQMLGGQLHIQSRPGKGSSVLIELPVLEPEEATDDTPVAAVAAGRGSAG